LFLKNHKISNTNEFLDDNKDLFKNNQDDIKNGSEIKLNLEQSSLENK